MRRSYEITFNMAASEALWQEKIENVPSHLEQMLLKVFRRHSPEPSQLDPNLLTLEMDSNFPLTEEIKNLTVSCLGNRDVSVREVQPSAFNLE